MQTLSTTSEEPVDRILVRFLRDLSELAARAALEIEVGTRLPSPRTEEQGLDDLDLGSLQRAIVHVPGMTDEEGVKPRSIAQFLERGDEPNIRMTLQALGRRGIAELVPGSSPQRWRLTSAYRDAVDGSGAAGGS